MGAGAMNTATRPRSPLSPGSRSTVPRWPNTPVDKGFRGVTRHGASTCLPRRGFLPPCGRISRPWSPRTGPAPGETPVLALRSKKRKGAIRPRDCEDGKSNEAWPGAPRSGRFEVRTPRGSVPPRHSTRIVSQVFSVLKSPDTRQCVVERYLPVTPHHAEKPRLCPEATV